MSEQEIKDWVKQNSSLISTKLSDEEIDHVAMCMEHLHEHYTKGRPVGSFLTAIVDNNFTEVCSRADDTNRKVLFLYALFKYNCIPYIPTITMENKEED